jgi:hypothetical protein
MSPRLRFAGALIALALAATACSSDEPPADGGGSPGAGATGGGGAAYVAQVASADLYVGAPQRVAVGMFANAAEGLRLVTSGEVEVAISPFEGGEGTPSEGTARYVPAPGTEVADAGPTLTDAAEARGVYELADVTFDAPGVWQASVTFTVDGEGPYTVAATPFEVAEDPAYPAPGDRALRTRNLTIRSDAPPEAIDSRAVGGGEIPDPELHRTTIADAIRHGRPVLAIFSTPTYCQSLFCGPVTEAIEALAAEHDDEAVFVHVEIWREHPSVLNEGAADWLYRDDNLTEPWLFLIGADGRVVDRWGPLFDVEEVGAMLADLPDMAR